MDIRAYLFQSSDGLPKEKQTQNGRLDRFCFTYSIIAYILHIEKQFTADVSIFLGTRQTKIKTVLRQIKTNR